LSRGGAATRALLQPLVLDLSAMGLRQTSKTNPAVQTNGHGPAPAVGPSNLGAGNMSVAAAAPEAIGATPFDPISASIEPS
jgi:hypothetical protein